MFSELAVASCVAVAAWHIPPTPEQVRASVAKSVVLLEASRAEYLNHRSCFSCHHQALPALALRAARSRGFEVDDASWHEQRKLTFDHLAKNRSEYRKGQGQGGQVDTAGSALWTLEIGAWKPDETTAAVAEYLLLKDKDRDHWHSTSTRPPSEASPFTTTYLALRGLKSFATEEQRQRAATR